MAFGSGRGGAPGTFIYEGAIATQAGRSSFNTTYMLVDAPDEASILTFPYNRPVAISSLAEYENLIGTIPSVGGPELTSYLEVKAFFQQAAVADLRVTRVGTPSTVKSLAFSPAANKDNGVSAPSALSKGDVVYLKLSINGVELGERTASDAWLGVPVTIPVNYIPGDISNNLLISQAMMNAAKVAIEANADLSAGVYIRETGSGDPSCDECSYIYLTGRIFNTTVEIVDSSVITGTQFIFATTAYIITNVTESDQTVYDWLQCVSTAFNEPNLPQGYMIAPAAFTEFKQADRVNLGQRMEEICADPNHKWMALIDCGPFYVTSIKAYSKMTEMDPADGFVENQEYLIDNVIYKWTDDNLSFTEAAYDATNATASANSALSDGARRALKDDRYLFAGVAATTATNILTLTSDVDLSVATGEVIEVSLTNVTPAPIAPTYSDASTGITSADLVGSFFVISRDVDPTLQKNQIKLASSKMRAAADQPVDILTAGTPQGGAMLTLRYSDPAWEFEVDIKGSVSNLIEVNNAAGASFNSLHFPATLQKKTEEYDFKAVVRQVTDLEKANTKGGSTLRYFGSQDIDDSADTITIGAHGYSTGDAVTALTVPGATGPSGVVFSNTTIYIIKVDDNTVKLASTEANAEAGTSVDLQSVGVNSSTVKSPLGGAVLGTFATGGDALIFSADHGLATADKVLFDAPIPTLGIQASTKDNQYEYYVGRVDRNYFRLALTASNLAAGAFIDYPTGGITENTPIRFYEATQSAENSGTFSNAGLLRFIRGRKYQMDVTLAVFLVEDEAGVKIENGTNDPYGNAYTADLSTDFRLSYLPNPEGINEYKVAAADVTLPSSLTISGHGYTTGQAIQLGLDAGATIPSGLVAGGTYFAIITDANTIKLASTLADAAAGTAVTMADVGVNGTGGYVFKVTSISNPYTYAYTEDENAVPLNNASDFAGDNNFYCTPLSDGDQANATPQVYGMTVLQTGNTYTTLYGSSTEIEFVEPATAVPDSLYNFNAVTGEDLVSEALRGVNNNGVPQAEVIETGMDNHSRLFAESQKYSTTQGFLAYYAPYILCDSGVYIPPTAFVTGLAMRRYRDEIGGFRLPPAGAKYSLAGARGVEVEITSGMQDVSNPYGLNALRQLPGYSTTDPDTGVTYGPVFVWGSRTRINPANAEQALYKFVNTRVILNVIYGSLRNALDNQIFNVIDGRAVTFNQIRTLCSNVLYSQFYVPGALFGASAADAFDVVVDDRNNPPANLDNGLVNVQIFVVPVPTLERIEIDLLRVSIGGIKQAQIDLGLQ